MWPFTRRAAESHQGLLNQLQTRVERLELDHAERQVEVLSALEKVLHQLRARERKRERDNGDGADVAQEEYSGGGVDPSGAAVHRHELAEVKRRMRGF